MIDKKKVANRLVYLVPGVIVCLIMLVIFFVKRLYPFTGFATLQIDADYNYVPTLFKIYDIFHYGDSFLWDFKLGGGANIYGSLVMNSIYSPINWLVIFTKRDNIVNFFNILLIIKYACMATTMFIFIHKNFKKVDIFWQILLSILYVFSGWGFLMYSNIFYIDTIILFPILMHFFVKFFKDGKCLGLVISLSYSVILNFYLSYMVYLFLIFSSVIALFLFVDKNERKPMIVKLSFIFVFPLFVSAFASWPTVLQIIDSVRSLSERRDGYFYFFFLKFLNLTMSAFLISLFTRNIRKGMFKDKKNLLIMILVFMTTIGVVIEPINCMWHTGSYNSFPYRYSFISIFVLICGCLNYLSNHNVIDEMSKVKFIEVLFVILMCEILIVVFLNKFNFMIKKEMIAYDIFRPGVFLTLVIIFSLLFFIYMYVFKLRNVKLQRFLIVLFVLFEIGLYGNWCFDDFNYRQSIHAVKYQKEFDFSDPSLYKYIDYQGGLGVNSANITRMATLSNWLHIIPQKQHDFIEKFGYSCSNSLIYGFGGTIFSDSLIGAKYFYSQLELPLDVFNLISEKDIDGLHVYLYEFKYPMSFGFKYDKGEFKEFDSAFDAQNYYYREMLGYDRDIVNTGTFEINNGVNKFKIDNNESVILYFEINDDLLNANIEKITVNGEDVFFGNSKKIVYLDEYKKSIEIEIDKKIEEDEEQTDETYFLKFGYIKVSDFKKISKKMQNDYNSFEYKKNKLYINIDSDKEQYLYLPINNINGWSGVNNGKKVDIQDELYSFMSVKLEEGNNDIKLEFYPPLFKESVLISIFSSLLLGLFVFFEKKISNNRFVQMIVVPIYYLVSVGLFVYVYIISNFVY